jgi:hypothetical protein
MNTQGTQTDNSAVYSHTGIDWQTRIVLLTPNGEERDGGLISYDGATLGQGTTESGITDMLIGMGYEAWFSLPGLAVFTGDDAPQTHAFVACLALGETPRVIAFETLTGLTAFVSQWTPVLEIVNDN